MILASADPVHNQWHPDDGTKTFSLFLTRVVTVLMTGDNPCIVNGQAGWRPRHGTRSREGGQIGHQWASPRVPRSDKAEELLLLRHIAQHTCERAIAKFVAKVIFGSHSQYSCRKLPHIFHTFELRYLTAKQGTSVSRPTLIAHPTRFPRGAHH